MRIEWQIYWKELKRSLRGYAIALGVSLVFYLFAIPRLHGIKQHLNYLLLSFMYGSVIYTWIWGLYSIQWAVMVKQHITRDRRLEIPWSTHIFLTFTGTIFGLLSANYIDSKMTGDPFTLARFGESLLVGLFIAMMFQFYYAYKHSANENSQLKAAKAEADLHVLQNQMQPHFLFNSLNSLASLIDQNPESAGLATQKLADLYRLILECSKFQMSPLQKELQIAELYLEIEKIRYGERLQFKIIQVSKNLAEVQMPSLIVQTLVENAVKHGINKSIEGGFIEVYAESMPDGTKVEVLNSGSSFVAIATNGTGLRNTKERLELALGPKSNFTIGSNSQGVTTAGFFIPRA